MSERRTEYRLTLIASPWLNSNQRQRRRVVAPLVKQWRDDIHLRARAARLPRGMERVGIVATLRFPDKRRRDPHNYMPTLKAAVDGLVDYGLIPDDNSEHLVGPDVRIGKPLSRREYKWLPPGVLELAITDLSGEA